MAINWVDRVATHPGRVQLTPVQGQTNIYDMERADEPTVAGTPVNAANLNAMQKNMGLDANMTVYVAVSGSDATGNGSSTSPYQTITKALSTIPKNLNGYTATVNISAGTYNESVVVNGYCGGYVLFTGVSGAVVSIKSLTLLYATSLVITNLRLNIVGGTGITYGIQITTSQFVCDNGVISVSNVSNGLYSVLHSTMYISTISFENSIVAATSTNGAQIIVGDISGNATSIGLRAASGGKIYIRNSNTISTPIAYETITGGRIYSGSQTSIPNY